MKIYLEDKTILIFLRIELRASRVLGHYVSLPAKACGLRTGRSLYRCGTALLASRLHSPPRVCGPLAPDGDLEQKGIIIEISCFSR